MPVTTFLALTTAGSLIWNIVFVMAGYLLGENWAIVETYARPLEWGVIAVVAVAVVWFVARRLVKAGRTRT